MVRSQGHMFGYQKAAEDSSSFLEIKGSQLSVLKQHLQGVVLFFFPLNELFIRIPLNQTFKELH